MLWLSSVMLGLFIWSCTLLIDRHLLLDKIANKSLYLLVAGIMHVLVTVLIIPFVEFQWLLGLPLLIGLGIGLLEAAGLYYLFTAISLDEITRVMPLGTMGAFFVLILAWLFLRETLSMFQGIAFVLFLIGGFLLAFKKSGKKFLYQKHFLHC